MRIKPTDASFSVSEIPMDSPDHTDRQRFIKE